VTLSPKLPSLQEAKERYEIPFDEYVIFNVSSCNAGVDKIKEYVDQLIQAILESDQNFVGVYPNNIE
jgi:UDP-N-acetylglucosamine 2-epimerase (hydrolysing)